MGNTRCITPIIIKNPKTGSPQEVPCQRCWPCLQRRANSWAARMLQEKKRSKSANFVTFTYNDKHIPINEESMLLTLDKKEIPLYMKRLRKAHDKVYKLQKIKKEDKPKIKYYAVGEYGDELERPHYHMIIFNAITELIPLSWNKAGTNEMLGMVQIGNKGVTAGGAKYLAEYMLTGQADYQEGRQKPFSLMSKNLGLNYITKEIIQWHLQRTGTAISKNGTIIPTRDRYYMIHNGHKIPLPRYYRDKIFPKIYREIDIPIILNKFQDKEYEEMSKDFSAYAQNQEGMRETNKSTLKKKIKQKQERQLEIQ